MIVKETYRTENKRKMNTAGSIMGVSEPGIRKKIDPH